MQPKIIFTKNWWAVKKSCFITFSFSKTNTSMVIDCGHLMWVFKTVKLAMKNNDWLVIMLTILSYRLHTICNILPTLLLSILTLRAVAENSQLQFSLVYSTSLNDGCVGKLSQRKKSRRQKSFINFTSAVIFSMKKDGDIYWRYYKVLFSLYTLPQICRQLRE